MGIRLSLFDGKGLQFIQTGGKNFYEIVIFFVACLQVKALPRLEKSALLEDTLPTPCSKKDISLYTEYADTPGLFNNRIRSWFASLSRSILIRWTEPLVWSIALEGKDDLDRFKALNWGLRTWDLWNWNDCDKRFGDDWPGRIPAQMIAHILYYFSNQNDLVLDPMAGGGVVADTCLAFNRKCWSFDMDDRPDTRPEIEPCFWDITNLKWPIKGKTKPDLIIFDPPYFKKQSNNYDPDGISGMSKANYLKFLESFFALAHLNAKKSTQMAFINADWPPARRAYASESAISKTPLPKMRPG